MISRAPYIAMQATFDPLPTLAVVKVGVATDVPELARVVTVGYPVVILRPNPTVKRTGLRPAAYFVLIRHHRHHYANDHAPNL